MITCLVVFNMSVRTSREMDRCEYCSQEMRRNYMKEQTASNATCQYHLGQSHFHRIQRGWHKPDIPTSTKPILCLLHDLPLLPPQCTNLLNKDKVLGSCVLGGFMLARWHYHWCLHNLTKLRTIWFCLFRGKGEEHWDKLKKFPKQVATIDQLSPSHNCSTYS